MFDQSSLAEILEPKSVEFRSVDGTLTHIRNTVRRSYSMETALAILTVEPFLDLICEGYTVAKLARVTGIKNRQLRKFLGPHLNAVEIRAGAAEALVDQANELLNDAVGGESTVVSAARAKALHLRWMAERIDSKTWDKTQDAQLSALVPFAMSWAVNQQHVTDQSYHDNLKQIGAPDELLAEWQSVESGRLQENPVVEVTQETIRTQADEFARLTPLDQVITRDNIHDDSGEPEIESGLDIESLDERSDY